MMKWTAGLKLTDDELLRYAYLSDDELIVRMAGVVERTQEQVLSEVVELTSELHSAQETAERFEELYLKSQSQRELELEQTIRFQQQREQRYLNRIHELEEQFQMWDILSTDNS